MSTVCSFQLVTAVLDNYSLVVAASSRAAGEQEQQLQQQQQQEEGGRCREGESNAEEDGDDQGSSNEAVAAVRERVKEAVSHRQAERGGGGDCVTVLKDGQPPIQLPSRLVQLEATVALERRTVSSGHARYQELHCGAPEISAHSHGGTSASHELLFGFFFVYFLFTSPLSASPPCSYLLLYLSHLNLKSHYVLPQL